MSDMSAYGITDYERAYIDLDIDDMINQTEYIEQQVMAIYMGLA